jgi:hypothetical protein
MAKKLKKNLNYCRNSTTDGEKISLSVKISAICDFPQAMPPVSAILSVVIGVDFSTTNLYL